MEPQQSRPTILLIEDSTATAAIVSDHLSENGYKCITTYNGRSGLSTTKSCHPDIILLDWELPDLSGIEVCERLRAQGFSLPIIMLTGRNEISDELTALKFGADDFIRKPAHKEVILARIACCLRRCRNIRDSRIRTWRRFDIFLDFNSFKAEKNDKPISLSTKEYEVLNLLIAANGSPVSRTRFLAEVWGCEHGQTSRTVDNYILSLRKKLETFPNKPEIILTKKGAGYYIPPSSEDMHFSASIESE